MCNEIVQHTVVHVKTQVHASQVLCALQTGFVIYSLSLQMQDGQEPDVMRRVVVRTDLMV